MARHRKYEQKARADSQERTRERITIAALELHEQLGPAQTSISAIADRAGVQRLTVYRHFADELTLLRACGGLYRARHPPPDLERWKLVADPRERLHDGLLELYRHFRETRAMWANVLRDAAMSPVVREAAEPRFRFLAGAAAILGEPWTAPLARAAIHHAVEFTTWQSLARGLTDKVAAELMTRFAAAAAR